MSRSFLTRFLVLATMTAAGCPAPGPTTAVIQGVVRDEYRDRRVPGAVVLHRESGAVAGCDAEGRFTLRVPAGGITLVVSAPGYLTLTRAGDPVPAGASVTDDLTIIPEAPDEATIAAWLEVLARGQARRDNPDDPGLRPEVAARLRAEREPTYTVLDDAAPGIHTTTLALNGTCQVAFATAPPATIRIWRRRVDGSTASCSGRVDRIVFEDYIKGVLPHEWIASWQRESLRAGAVAIRTYAWRWVLSGGKYDCADLDDTSASQVYEPTRYAATDRAVDDTAGEGIVHGGSLTSGEYSAENGDPTAYGVVDSVCHGRTRNGHGRGMCQWGSQRWAQAGQTYDWIANHYYPDSQLGCRNGRGDAGVDVRTDVGTDTPRDVPVADAVDVHAVDAADVPVADTPSDRGNGTSDGPTGGLVEGPDGCACRAGATVPGHVRPGWGLAVCLGLVLASARRRLR